MNPEKQRIAIAEACGWTRCKILESSYGGHGDLPRDGWQRPDGVKFYPHKLPDYLNDLNAMHEAEKSLKSLQWVSYERKLQVLCDQTITWPMHSTAAQRAEAFLRVIGTWEDGKGTLNNPT